MARLWRRARPAARRNRQVGCELCAGRSVSTSPRTRLAGERLLLARVRAHPPAPRPVAPHTYLPLGQLATCDVCPMRPPEILKWQLQPQLSGKSCYLVTCLLGASTLARSVTCRCFSLRNPWTPRR
eukprot:scaffold95827_cov25-Tisochrysis_lutea.AAC.1